MRTPWNVYRECHSGKSAGKAPADGPTASPPKLRAKKRKNATTGTKKGARKEKKQIRDLPPTSQIQASLGDENQDERRSKWAPAVSKEKKKCERTWKDGTLGANSEKGGLPAQQAGKWGL